MSEDAAATHFGNSSGKSAAHGAMGAATATVAATTVAPKVKATAEAAATATARTMATRLLISNSSLLSEIESRCGLAVRRYAGKQKDLGSTRFCSPFSSNMVVYGHCLATLPTLLMKH